MSVMKDVRYALRTMTVSKGFTAAAVVALALGIGANTAIFTVVNAVLLRPLPYPEADRMIFATRTFPGGRSPSISPPKFFVWKQTTDNVLENLAVFDIMGPGVSLSGQGDPEQVKAIHASADYFPLFRVAPAAGRFYTADEDRPGGPRVAVISNGLWKRRFGADPGLVGRSVILSGEPYTIVGVTAAGFQPNPPADVWLPTQLDPNGTSQGHYLLCGARLKPGITIERANAGLKIAGEQFRRRYPDAMGDKESAGAIPMREFFVGDIRPMLLIMLGAVAFVLLIACANVANLLLARSAAREKELAVRTALGAGRARLIRQLLVESGLLAFSGGFLGLLLGYWGLKVLLAFAPNEIPRLSEMAARPGLDLSVLAFTIGVSALTGLAFGLMPAIHVSRPDLSHVLREGSGRGSSSGVRHLRARGLLVITEMALGVVLLAGAGLLIRSAMSLRSVRCGFEPANILTFKTALTGQKFATTAAVAQFTRIVTDKLESTPGIEAAANAISIPTEMGPDLPFEIQGRPASSGNNTGDEQWRSVSPHYFRAMRIPLLRGRGFTETDTAGAAPVVVINEALARKYWKTENPVGQQIWIGKGVGPEFNEAPREIVGVVGSVREGGLDTDPPPVMYVPQAQVTDGFTAIAGKVLPTTWVLRTAVNPLSMATIVRRQVTATDSQQAVFEFRSMEQVFAKSTANRAFVLLLLTIFAGTALALAAIGIYGVMSYAVEQRTHEIGIRMALGAGRADVLTMVLRYGAVLIGVGVAIGLAGAFGITRVLSNLLFGVKASDPVTFAGVAVILAGVALIATWLPARRATRVDPIIALRYQ